MTRLLLAMAACGALLATHAVAQAPAPSAPRPEVSLWRLDCGEGLVTDLDVFSDTWLYAGKQKRLTVSCYLIRHGDRYLLWDTGLPAALVGQAPSGGVMQASLRTTVLAQLATLGVKPEQIKFVGISHYHDDHTGQVSDFARGTLLVGAGDWEVIRGRPQSAERFRPWISGGSTVQAVARDHDVFGDGSVVMLDMPGHTPGHHALLVRLRNRAPVLLTGDLFHFTSQIARRGVPSFNTNRADTLASFDRFLAIARNLKAQIIIQHEPDDIAKLPPFPRAAR